MIFDKTLWYSIKIYFLFDLTATGLNNAPKKQHCNKMHPNTINVNFQSYFADKYSTSGAKTKEPTPD